MDDLASSFEEAWARFQTLDTLQLVGDPFEQAWTHGRAQNLAFIVRVEDAAAREHLSTVAGRLAGIPGVELLPAWFLHVTIKIAGFQVIERTHDDDILRQDVPQIASGARSVLAQQDAFQAHLGRPNAFRSVVFLEVWDSGRMRGLNAQLAEELEVARYAIDGAGFQPHVSIARFTSNEGLDQLTAHLAELRSAGPGPSFPVRRVEFVKAWLSDEPSEFETLATYPLRNPS